MLKSKTIIKGALRSKGVVEVPDTEIKRTKKYLDRLSVQEEVFDINDSVADNAKLISLMMTTMSRMYDILDTAQKDLLDPAERAVIESTFSKFSATTTRADVQFATEGEALIDKLLARQALIGSIVT